MWFVGMREWVQLRGHACVPTRLPPASVGQLRGCGILVVVGMGAAELWRVHALVSALVRAGVRVRVRRNRIWGPSAAGPRLLAA
jgi:hypothetical protein